MAAIQTSGALLDGCVLSILAREDTYGYSLTQRIKERLDVSESTFYPVMRRLQTDDCLKVYDVPHNGRMRRYYGITEKGKRKLRECAGEWVLFKKKIDTFLSGEEGNNHDTV